MVRLKPHPTRLNIDPRIYENASKKQQALLRRLTKKYSNNGISGVYNVKYNKHRSVYKIIQRLIANLDKVERHPKIKPVHKNRRQRFEIKFPDGINFRLGRDGKPTLEIEGGGKIVFF